MSLLSCCFNITFWYAPSSSTPHLSSVKDLAYQNLGFMLVGKKNGSIGLGFTVIWDLGFHHRVFQIYPDVRQITWLLIVSDFRS
jgi:hypothetical protein